MRIYFIHRKEFITGTTSIQHNWWYWKSNWFCLWTDDGKVPNNKVIVGRATFIVDVWHYVNNTRDLLLEGKEWFRKENKNVICSNNSNKAQTYTYTVALLHTRLNLMKFIRNSLFEYGLLETPISEQPMDCSFCGIWLPTCEGDHHNYENHKKLDA
jgi:hypothetical protein